MKQNDAVPAKAGILLAFTGLLLCLPAFAAHAQNVTFLELYTSQGCPSCPPADRLLLDLIKQPGTIAMACHVTYFDKMGRNDNLAIKPCNDRHAAYRNAGVTNKIYTPMAIINGRAFMPGSNEKAIRETMRTLSKIPEIILRKENNHLNIDLPSMRVQKAATLWIFAIDRMHQVTVRSGTSARTASYANAVRHVSQLFIWDGRPMKMALPIDGINVDDYIVLAQYKDGTDVIAAGQTR